MTNRMCSFYQRGLFIFVSMPALSIVSIIDCLFLRVFCFLSCFVFFVLCFVCAWFLFDFCIYFYTCTYRIQLFLKIIYLDIGDTVFLCDTCQKCRILFTSTLPLVFTLQNDFRLTVKESIEDIWLMFGLKSKLHLLVKTKRRHSSCFVVTTMFNI